LHSYNIVRGKKTEVRDSARTEVDKRVTWRENFSLAIFRLAARILTTGTGVRCLAGGTLQSANTQRLLGCWSCWPGRLVAAANQLWYWNDEIASHHSNTRGTTRAGNSSSSNLVFQFYTCKKAGVELWVSKPDKGIFLPAVQPASAFVSFFVGEQGSRRHDRCHSDCRITRQASFHF
jgi:hypothetical protein